MQAPSLSEFKHLYDVNAADHDGFPSPVIHNKALFAAALERMSPPRREALWQLLGPLHANAFSVYYTGTVEDRGFRAGLRRVGATDADLVLARCYFPAIDEPTLDIYARTVGRIAFAEVLDQPLFERDGLSPVAQRLADELRAITPAGKIISDFLDSAQPYVAASARQMLAHRLPVSHPVGGLKAGSAAERFRAEWREAVA